MRNLVDKEFPIELSWGNATTRLNCSISYELMEYNLSGMTFEASRNHPINAVQDNKGAPVIFSVMQDNDMYGVFSINDAYKAINLTKGLKPGSVGTFAVSQNERGKITLAVSIHDSNGDLLYISSPIDNDLGSMEALENITWHIRPDKEKHNISRIYLGTDDDKRGTSPMIIATRDKKGADKEQFYVVSTDPGKEGTEWEEFRLPDNVDKIVSMALGSHSKGRGVYVLYLLNGEQFLRFITIGEEYHSITLAMPKNAAALEVLYNGEYTDLYIGGEEGMHILLNSKQSKEYKHPSNLVELAGPDTTSGIKEIIVRDDQKHIAVWGIDKEKKLYYVKGTKGDGYSASNSASLEKCPGTPDENLVNPVDWEKSIVIRKNLDRLAPICNKVLQTNTIMLQEDKNNILKLQQNPDNQLWMSTAIPLPDDGKINKAKAYVTQLTITKEDGSPYIPEMEKPRQGYKELVLNLTASEYTQVEVNGLSRTIGKDESIKITPDKSGLVTLIYKTNGINVPVFYISGEGYKETINPGLRVQSSLKKIEKGDDLKKVTLPSGRRLIDPARERDLDQGVEVLKKINHIAAQMPQNGSKMPVISELAQRGFDITTAFGFSYSPEHGLRFYNGEDLNNMFKNENWLWKALVRWAGDTLEWAKSVIGEVFEFAAGIIAGVWYFGIKIGEQFYKFAVDCLSKAYSGISWFLKEGLGIDLDKIIEWLGFFYDCNEIIATKEVIKHLATESLDYGKKQLKELSNKVDGAFDSMLDTLKNKRSVLKDKSGVSQGVEGFVKAKMEGAKPESERALELLKKNPGGSFANTAIINQFGKGGSDLWWQLEEELKDGELEKFFKETLEPFFQNLKETVEKIAKDFLELFEKQGLTLESFVDNLVTDTLEGILKALRDIVKGILSLLDNLAGVLEKLLKKEINIPFVMALYKELTQSSEITLLDIFAFIFAIPATFTYKLIKGQAPYQLGKTALVNLKGEELFKAFRTCDTDEFTLSADVKMEIKITTHVSGFVHSIYYEILNIVKLIALCLETNVPAAWETIPLWLETVCSVPVGEWKFSNTGGFICKIFLVLKNLFSVVIPTTPQFGNVANIITSLIKGCFDIFCCIASIIEGKEKIDFVIWKGIESILGDIASLGMAAAGLMPASTPYGAKYIVACLSSRGQTVRNVSLAARSVTCLAKDCILT